MPERLINTQASNDSIPEEYFISKDYVKSGEKLLSSDFAANSFFAENEDRVVIQAYIQKASDMSVHIATGVKDKASGEWRWYNYAIGKDAGGMFAAPAKALTDDSELIFLADPYKILDAGYDSSALIGNRGGRAPLPMTATAS